MSKPKACPPAPGPLEEFAARFDDLFTHLAQRRAFRQYLAGLLAPRDRNKTVTALAGAAPADPVERGRHQPTRPASRRTWHHPRTTPAPPELAPRATRGPILADPGHHAHTLVDRLVHQAPTA